MVNSLRVDVIGQCNTKALAYMHMPKRFDPNIADTIVIGAFQRYNRFHLQNLGSIGHFERSADFSLGSQQYLPNRC